MKSIIIFGGSGFIGTFLAHYFLNETSVEKIYIYDIESISDKKNQYRNKLLSNSNKIFFSYCDVRKVISIPNITNIDLIINLAAVHREPGHKDSEYFETNLLGAENICAFAEKISCNKIIFSSSISPYGLSEEIRDESSIPSPSSAYGSSKLLAEKIHEIWQVKDPKNRILQIVRPGVVFGPGEDGNVSRLIKAVSHRYFFYMGNRNTRKAGVYVKELCNAMTWELSRQISNKKHFSLFNMSMNPGPSIQEYVETICSTAKIKRFIPEIPYRVLIITSHFFDFIARGLKINNFFSPVRVKKLIHSNNIRPKYLVENGYRYLYSLESAFLDWKRECPEEWQ